jgi:hypothetical protein
MAAAAANSVSPTVFVVLGFKAFVPAPPSANYAQSGNRKSKTNSNTDGKRILFRVLLILMGLGQQGRSCSTWRQPFNSLLSLKHPTTNYSDAAVIGNS